MKRIIEQVPNKNLIAIILVFVVTAVFATTVGEFVVALHNRYSVYPSGWDTDMYGNSLAVSWGVCLLGAYAVSWLFTKEHNFKMLIVLVVSFFILASVSSNFPNFLPSDWCKYELSIYPCY